MSYELFNLEFGDLLCLEDILWEAITPICERYVVWDVEEDMADEESLQHFRTFTTDFINDEIETKIQSPHVESERKNQS